MTARATPHLAPQLVDATSTERDWFLRDSGWSDPVWVLVPTSVLDAERPIRLHWDFLLPSGQLFTDQQYTVLLEHARKLIALIRTRSLGTGLGQRARTVQGYFSYLRELVRWMDREGFARFVDLDSTALLQFQRSLRGRRGEAGATLAPSTVQKYLHLLVYLYRFREEIGDGLKIDPCQGESTGRIAGVRDADRARWPYTPDSVAVALIQGAMEFLTNCAADVLRARELYAAAITQARVRGCGGNARDNAAVRVLRDVTIVTTRGSQRIDSLADLAQLVDMLYVACFVVISYLVGLRASEVLHLQANCVQSRSAQPASDDSSSGPRLAVIVGAIFKREAQYHGRRHEWVAPQPAVHAISVLEALSAAHRARSGRTQLWMRTGHRSRGATEWQHGCKGPLQIPQRPRINKLLNQFAAWIGVPLYEGKPWRLSTHQGRKTFARFVALRDRSALFALSQHLGHRERAITDCGYAGTDYALNFEIDAQILEQSVSAWEHMLATPTLGGRAGAEILAKRPRFRGTRMKQDLKSYARMLVEAGLTLGVCEWGFCVYQEKHSACLGNACGPNPALREPSTCVRCRNFAVSTQHRAYWAEQGRRHEALLNEPALPTQTLKIARERLAEALATIRSIDSDAKEGRNGSQAARN
jgi:integrase